jgi:hypothetical protein
MVLVAYLLSHERHGSYLQPTQSEQGIPESGAATDFPEVMLRSLAIHVLGV